MAGFLRRAIHWFARRGVGIERGMSDNGSAYHSRVVAAACQALRVAQRWTGPYRPQTNGKAEHFIQTLLREWAYGRPYATSFARQQALPAWLHAYNWHRPHGGLHGRPPISRLASRDNLVSLHTPSELTTLSGPTSRSASSASGWSRSTASPTGTKALAGSAGGRVTSRL